MSLKMLSKMLRYLLLCVLYIFTAFVTADLEDERYLAKPWYARDIFIGEKCLYISPVTAATLLAAIYTLYSIFYDKSYCVASHILLTSEDAEKKLAEFKKEIKTDPAKFAELAAKHSTCPSGKQGGGNLGKFKRGVMAPQFDRAAFDGKNEVNTVVGPIQTAFGWHLIWIHERRIDFVQLDLA